MRLAICPTALLLLAACTHPPPPEPPPLAPVYPAWQDVPALVHAMPAAAAPQGFGWMLDAPAESQPLAGGAALQTLSVSRGGHAVELRLIAFDSGDYELRVIDQPGEWAGGGKITELMRRAGATAGVNGGFFTPEFTPLGLMIADGQKTGTWQSNKLLTGAVVVDAHPQLLWSAEVRTRDARQLLQAGPRLIDAGRPVTSLEGKKHSTRTFIATDGGQRWFLGLAGNVSLGELAEILASADLTGTTLDRALNLDGGRSSAIYYRTADGRDHTDPGWSTVRNYLAIFPR